MTAPGRPDLPLTAPIVAPSILSADFSRLAEALAVADPARDWVHCDVMDNHFVPNLTFGPLIIAAARHLTRAFLDVHLMIHHPERLLEAFIEAGADQVTLHLEAEHDSGLMDVIRTLRARGTRVGMAIKPGTRFESVVPYLRHLDLLLVMTVEPGFGGQAFMPEMLAKVSAARDWRARHAASFLIEVDGGIAVDTASASRAAGADVFVAGSAVYRAPDPPAALDQLRRAVGA